MKFVTYVYNDESIQRHTHYSPDIPMEPGLAYLVETRILRRTPGRLEVETLYQHSSPAVSVTVEENLSNALAASMRFMDSLVKSSDFNGVTETACRDVITVLEQAQEALI